MRAVVIALGCLAASFSLPVLANGQSQIADPQVRDQLFWNQLYGAGGTSLYCAKGFSGESGGALLSASPIHQQQAVEKRPTLRHRAPVQHHEPALCPHGRRPA
jgi:deoxyribonuclease-1